MLVYVLMAVPLLLAVWRRLRRVKAVAGPVLNISTGQIQGSILPSTAGRPFHAFQVSGQQPGQCNVWGVQGIPFARPPLGPRRFLRPEPAECWDGVRQCNSALQFTQINIFRAGSPREGREDGLVLNVYSPHLYPDQVSLGWFLPTLVCRVAAAGDGVDTRGRFRVGIRHPRSLRTRTFHGPRCRPRHPQLQALRSGRPLPWRGVPRQPGRHS